MERITTKAQMYRLLVAGELGNTVPQWLSLDQWERDGVADAYPMWGVRSLVVGGPCRLYCPAGEVRRTVEGFSCPYNISVMLDSFCDVTLYADVYDSDTGLQVYAVEYPGRGESWRVAMPRRGRQWAGLRAWGLLRKHMNQASLDDLYGLLERYPGHVVEFSAISRCFGTVSGRNSVIWECRLY